MKKRILIFVLIIILLFTGCTNKIAKKSASKIPELEGKLTVWVMTDCNNTLKIAGENFKKQYPKVDIQIVNFDAENIYDKLNGAIISDDSGIDLVTVENSYVSELIKKFPKGFVDISSYISGLKSGFSKNSLKMVTSKNTVMAFPWYENVAAIYYRRDILQKANVDVDSIKTWDDYINAGNKIKESTGGTTRLLGFNEKVGDDFFRMLLAQLHCGYIGEDGKSSLYNESSIKAMGLIKKLHDQNLYYNYTDTKSLIGLLKNNSIASMPQGSNFSGNLMELCPEQKGKWSIMKLPAFEAGGSRAASYSSTSLMVPSTSKNIKLAEEFAKFTISDNASVKQITEKTGVMPSYAPAYDSLSLKVTSDYFSGQNITALFMDIDNFVYDINYNYNYQDIKQYILDSQWNILNNNLTIKDNLKTLSDKVDGLLAQ